MKEKILRAETKIEIERINNIDGMEINFLLSEPEENRGYHRIERSVNPHLGHPASMPERKDYAVAKEDRSNNSQDRSNNNVQNRANVRVNSVLVNVNTRRV